MKKKEEVVAPKSAIQIANLFSAILAVVYALITLALIFSFIFATYKVITGKWINADIESLGTISILKKVAPTLVEEAKNEAAVKAIIYFIHIPLAMITGITMYIYDELRKFTSKLRKKVFISQEVMYSKIKTLIKLGWFVFGAKVVLIVMGGDTDMGIHSVLFLVTLYILKYFIESKYITINDKN